MCIAKVDEYKLLIYWRDDKERITNETRIIWRRKEMACFALFGKRTYGIREVTIEKWRREVIWEGIRYADSPPDFCAAEHRIERIQGLLY